MFVLKVSSKGQLLSADCRGRYEVRFFYDELGRFTSATVDGMEKAVSLGYNEQGDIVRQTALYPGIGLDIIGAGELVH